MDKEGCGERSGRGREEGKKRRGEEIREGERRERWRGGRSVLKGALLLPAVFSSFFSSVSIPERVVMVMEWKNVRYIITRPSGGECCFVAVHSVAGA